MQRGEGGFRNGVQRSLSDDDDDGSKEKEAKRSTVRMCEKGDYEYNGAD